MVWYAVGFLVLVGFVVGVILIRRRPPPLEPPVPGMQTNALSGPAPDISALTPRQRFDRLYDRAMSAAEQRDTANVIGFSRHALNAYSQLDFVDEDARYHAAVMHAQLGEFPPALALADTILAAEPQHLFGFLIRGTVAQLQGDGVALARAREAFLKAWPAEQALDRPEYRDHQQVLDDFYLAAKAAASGQPEQP
jgi:hypothetical protein